MLEALCIGDPQSPHIPTLLKELLDCRINGRWNSTQENTWSAIAITAYFRGNDTSLGVTDK
jgi:hypothetical protein